MSGFLARPWTASRVRFTGTDPILALVIVSKVIGPLVRFRATTATGHHLRRCFATDRPGVSIQVPVNVDVVTVRGRMIVSLVKNVRCLLWNLVVTSQELF